jgi:hypothetical protein
MKPIDQRELEFKKQVQEVGRLIYTQEMLSRFSEKWTEPDRAPGIRQRMKFEKEKTFDIKRRLVTWSNNNFDGIQCFLTDSQKTIAQKKHAFAISLEPYLEKYGRDTLNEFFRFWAEVENKPNPKLLKWEGQDFWELSSRLESWVRRSGVSKSF